MTTRERGLEILQNKGFTRFLVATLRYFILHILKLNISVVIKSKLMRKWNLFRLHASLIVIKILDQKIADINSFEKKIYSQNGEDGIIEIMFYAVGVTNRFFVEIGGGDGTECNTRYLAQKGWNGIMIDARACNPLIKNEFVTAENVCDIFEKYNVPKEFDLLSIDIDTNDYWIWKALEGYSPRVVVIEYNATHPPYESKVVKYDAKAVWDGTNYFGASLFALVKLGKVKGYTLIGCDNLGVNAFFVRNDLKEHFSVEDTERLYRPPKYGQKINGVHIGHPPSDNPWIIV